MDYDYWGRDANMMKIDFVLLPEEGVLAYLRPMV